MSKRHADSTSDESPSKRRRCEADEVSVAIAFENVCKWCREDKPELLEEVLSKEFAPGTSNVRRLDAYYMGYHWERVTPLMICAANDHIECLILLLGAGARMDVASPSGVTALHFASRGNLDCLSELITRGASVGAVDSDGNTALHYAAKGNLDCLNELITRGASVGAVDSTGNTALHASAHGSSLIVDMLLKGGASVDARNKGMQTPLHVACRNHNTSAAVALLEGGASVVAVDCDGDTALHYVGAFELQFPAYEPHSNVVNMLLERGASVDACNKVMQTPLHVACACDNTSAALAFLERGASVVAVDCNGNGVLHCAVGIDYNSTKEGHHRVVVDMLLERGVSVDVRNRQSETPLHLASKCGNDPAVAALLQAGASVDAVDPYRNTALHLAVSIDSNHEECRDLLTIHALQDAVVLLLLMHGASVYARNISRETPLITATNGHANDWVVRTLLNMGAEVDAVDREGNTALHCAWLSYNPWKGYRVTFILDKFNASDDLPNNEGRTAAEIADETEYVSYAFDWTKAL